MPPAHAPSTARFAIRLGFVPLLDSAPLIIAQEKGFFEKQGVSVRLHREAGWSTVRDKLAFGDLDGATAPIGLAFSLSLGTDCIATPITAPLLLTTNGNAITLSRDIPSEAIGEKGGLKTHFSTRPADARKPTFAAVHPWASHSVLMLSWLARHGMHAGKDYDMLYLPPPVMARNLAAKNLDGFCVGEPWNSLAIEEGSGWCAARSSTMANGEPEKAFLMTRQFIERQPEISGKLVTALIEACRYCANEENFPEVISIISKKQFLDCSPTLLKKSLSQNFNTGFKEVDASATRPFIFDHRLCPDPSSANWLITGLRMISVLGKEQNIDLNAVFDPSLFQAAAVTLGHKNLLTAS